MQIQDRLAIKFKNDDYYKNPNFIEDFVYLSFSIDLDVVF